MIPFYQTDTTSVSGNCVQYAVASLLEIEPADVPVFEPTSYLSELFKFTNSNQCLLLPSIRFDSSTNILVWRSIAALGQTLKGVNCLLGVRSFHHRHVDHCVVGRFGDNDGLLQVIHDPNRANGLRNPAEYVIRDVDVSLPVTDRAEDVLRRHTLSHATT